MTHHLNSANINIFTSKVSMYCYFTYFNKNCISIVFSKWFYFYLFFKCCFKLMMSTKLATPSLLKINMFWSEGYGVIISIFDITNKFLSRALNYFVDVAIWPKFSNSGNSMREFITTSVILGVNQKNQSMSKNVIPYNSKLWHSK